MSPPEDRRSAGIAKMQEIYGFAMDPGAVRGRYMEMTVDHLFGTVWTGDELDVRERRLLTIGVLAAQGKTDLLEMQFDSVLRWDELTADELREVVVHLTHYIGWPLSVEMNQAAEGAIARRAGAVDDGDPVERA